MYKEKQITDGELIFHKERIAFAIMDKQVYTTAHDTRGHEQWLREDYGVDDKAFEQLVRGYVKEDTIVFYKGRNFIEDYEVLLYAYEYSKKLALLTPARQVKVYTGVTIGKVGQVWEPKRLLLRLTKYKDGI